MSTTNQNVFVSTFDGIRKIIFQSLILYHVFMAYQGIIIPKMCRDVLLITKPYLYTTLGLGYTKGMRRYIDVTYMLHTRYIDVTYLYKYVTSM